MSSYIPWYPILFATGLVITATVSYYSSQISLAEELGDRPTRHELNGHVQELKEIIIREVQEIKEQQKEVRQDIRDLRQVILDNVRLR